MRELTRPIHAAMNHVARAQLRLPSFGRATLRRDGDVEFSSTIGRASVHGAAAVSGETVTS